MIVNSREYSNTKKAMIASVLIYYIIYELLAPGCNLKSKNLVVVKYRITTNIGETNIWQFAIKLWVEVCDNKFRRISEDDVFSVYWCN